MNKDMVKDTMKTLRTQNPKSGEGRGRELTYINGNRNFPTENL